MKYRSAADVQRYLLEEKEYLQGLTSKMGICRGSNNGCGNIFKQERWRVLRVVDRDRKIGLQFAAAKSTGKLLASTEWVALDARSPH